MLTPRDLHGGSGRDDKTRDAVDRLLVHAARTIQVLAATSPTNGAFERGRLVEALGRGDSPRPRWTYAPRDHADLRKALAAAAATLGPRIDASSRARLDRVRELDAEAALCEASGSPSLGGLARSRFAPFDVGTAHEASALAAQWRAEPRAREPEPDTTSDGDGERSLLSRMRAEVGRRRLPFTVAVHRPLAPLAATGDGVILVAPGRPITDEDVARTVLHEIEGHAVPRARACRSSIALVIAGTARGVDHQEGRALVLEERHGVLGPKRRRQLALRHWAVEAMHDRATFPDVALALVREHGVDAANAILVAERVFRGSHGERPGLGRERIYLESFLLVRTHLARRPQDEALLGSGQIGLDAIPAVAAAFGDRPPSTRDQLG